MSTMTDQLVEIQFKDLENLKNLYIPDGLKCYIAYATICNYISWLQQDPNESKFIHFYCLNGDFSDGTFVVTERRNAYADTVSSSFENLERLLQLVNYSKGHFFLSMRSQLRPVLENALQNVNVELDNIGTTLLYSLPKEEALKFVVPVVDDLELRPMTELRDIEKANSVWPHRSPKSLQYLQRCAKFNPSIGAFKKDGTLVSWVFILPNGLLGALQTDENYYGHGYAAIVVKYISKRVAEMGFNINAGIFEANTPSRSLFSKLGFKSIGEVHWMGTKNVWTTPDD